MISVNSAVAVVVAFATLAFVIWGMSVTEESRNIYRGPPPPQPQAAAAAASADPALRS